MRSQAEECCSMMVAIEGQISINQGAVPVRAEIFKHCQLIKQHLNILKYVHYQNHQTCFRMTHDA